MLGPVLDFFPYSNHDSIPGIIILKPLLLSLLTLVSFKIDKLHSAIKSAFPGGTADSISSDDCVFDLGIHVLHTKDPAFYEITDEVGAGFVKRIRSAWIYSHGTYSAYPFQVNSFYLPLWLRIRCVCNYLFRRNHRVPENYYKWMVQNFGKGFTEIFLAPYAEKFWRVCPKQMTYEWVGPRVPHPRTLDIIKGAFRNQHTSLGPNARYFYPSKVMAGYAGIAQAIASKVRNVRYKMKATAIDPVAKAVVFNDGTTTVNYDFLISTLPLPDLLR